MTDQRIKLSFHTSKCDGGQCKITGAYFTRLCKTGLSELIQARIAKNNTPLFSVRQGSITFTNTEEISLINKNDNFASIMCSGCGNVVNIYVSRCGAYAQMVSKKRQTRISLPPKTSSDNNLSRLSPLILPLINSSYTQISLTKAKEISMSQGRFDLQGEVLSEELDSEEDFNLMFSNTEAPIVGSYTDSLMAVSYSPIF